MFFETLQATFRHCLGRQKPMQENYTYHSPLRPQSMNGDILGIFCPFLYITAFLFTTIFLELFSLFPLNIADVVIILVGSDPAKKIIKHAPYSAGSHFVVS